MNMPTVGCVGESIIGNDERGLWFLSHKDDPSQMNWVEGEKCWGSVKVPMGLNVTRTLSVLENGELEECYTFENVSGEPLFIKEKDAYIYVPFNDSYEKAEVGLEKRCNAHLFIGENATYVMALRQGGRAPHLGLVLTKGSIIGYGVERDFSARSEDRGDFLFYPKLGVFEPGEKKEIRWKLFWHQGKDDFYNRLLNEDEFLLVKAEQMTCIQGENFEFCVQTKNKEMAQKLFVKFNEKEIKHVRIDETNDKYSQPAYSVWYQYPAEKEGEYRFDIWSGEKHTHALFYCSASVSSAEIGEAVAQTFLNCCKEKKIYLAAQCCEHLNRAIIIEKTAAKEYRLPMVNVVPKLKAGGSFATAVYAALQAPVAVEAIQAHAGIDIGDTLIGMHLRSVAVPVRIGTKHIGEAHVVCARTRLKFIGGERASYLENEK